jgi:hypothetical protein
MKKGNPAPLIATEKAELQALAAWLWIARPSADSVDVKPAGKPDAGNPHVRFDERGGETGQSRMA